jgi:hypothetical protein
MAPSSLTLNYDAVLSTTLFNYRKTLEDAISTTNAFLFYLMKKVKNGYQVISDIGDRMAMPLMYEIGNADSYSGYDVLDVTPADGITMAFYNWAQAAVPISISGLEEKKNRGEERILNLLESKTMQAELGLQTFFNQRMLQGAGGSAITTAYVSAMNGSSFVDPLPLQVAFDPTQSVSIGNINQNTNLWWRNQVNDFSSGNYAATTYAQFLKGLRHLRNNSSKGPGGPPDLHLVTQGTEELYEAALAASHRNPSYQVADIPFDNVAFYGKPVTWDEFVPDFGDGTVTQTKGSWVMLNTKFWGMRVDKETNFAPTPFIKPENQDAKTSHILWLGAMGCSNRRKQGVGGKIDETISS